MTTTIEITPVFQGRGAPYALPEVTYDAGPVEDRDGGDPTVMVGFSIMYSPATYYGKPDVMAEYFASIASDLQALADRVAAGGDPADVTLADRHTFYRRGIGMVTL